MRRVFLVFAAAVSGWCAAQVFGFLRAFIGEHSDVLMLATRRVVSADGIDSAALGLLSWTLLIVAMGFYFRTGARRPRA